MAAANEHGVPEQLYHVVLYYIRSQTLAAPYPAFPLGTYTDLNVAKEHARVALHELGYEDDDFSDFQVHDAQTKTWAHGDGVVVWAKVADDSIVKVVIDTTSNDEQLPERHGHQLSLPKGSDRLHYVVQTVIDLNEDRSGGAHQSGIEGVYAHRADAITAAKRQLADLAANDEFAQYEERNELQEDKTKDWPFGEDVIVHAIAQSGENYYIAVQTVPGTHHWHKKHISNQKSGKKEHAGHVANTGNDTSKSTGA